jgi:hypothetical protein
MNAMQKEVFRRAVLSVLDANRTRFGLGVNAIALTLSAYGFAKTADDEVADALDYIAAKNLCEEVTKTISKENRAWRITSAGIAFLDQ